MIQSSIHINSVTACVAVVGQLHRLADCWEIVNAYGVSDMVVLQLGPLRKMLTSHLYATRMEAATGLREGYVWPCSAPRDGSDGIKLTNRTTRSSAA